MKYLSVIAKIHMDCRPRLVNKDTGAFYIIPRFEDLRTVLDLIDKAGSNIRPYQAEWYEKIFIPAIDEMGNKPKEYWEDGQLIEKEIHVGIGSGDLAERTEESAKKIRDDFLYPLLNCGLIDCVKSVIDGREKIWFPVDNEDKAFSLFENQNDKRLTITDPSVYPYSLVMELEQSTRRRKIYDAEIAIRK